MGTQLPSQKRRTEPQFSAHLYCGQTPGCIKVPLGMEVCLSIGDCVRWGPSPYPKRRSPTQFSAHVYCGQTAAWIKMPLGMEVDLGLRDIVFDMNPATPRQKGYTHSHPIFGPCLLWPNGWMDEDAAWYESRPRPRPHCTRRSPSSCERETVAPYFRPMSIVVTVADLSYW